MTAKRKGTGPLPEPRLAMTVESILRAAQDPLSLEDLSGRVAEIPRKELDALLGRLEEDGKIARLEEGIVWIFEDDASDKLKRTLRDSRSA